MGHTAGSRGGGGGRASQSRSSPAGRAGLGGLGGIGGETRETFAERKAKKEREKAAGIVGTVGKVAQFGLNLLKVDPLSSLLVAGATKGLQELTKRQKPGGFQAGDPGLAPGLEGGGEGKGAKGTLLGKAATPAEAVAAQPDAAAKEIERKRRLSRGKGRTQTILAGRKIAEEQRAKTLLGQ